MSATKFSRKEMIDFIKKIVPPLDYSRHKGQAGRIGVVGGSREYTGAPYYAAYSSLKVGADLSFIFCHDSAATAIKSYSPELIVYPTFKTHEKSGSKEMQDEALEIMTRFFENLHALIIGPGLGRDDAVMDCIKKIIEKAKEKELPLVIDGDGLYLVSKDPSIVKGYPYAILTPNVNEYAKLCEAVNIKKEDGLIALCKSFGNVTILKKGEKEEISDGTTLLECSEQGGPRRCGGQGDLMAGAIGTFLGWANNYRKEQMKEGKSNNDNILGQNAPPLMLLPGYAGSMLTRMCGKAAFQKHHRSTTTPEMIAEIGEQFESLFPSSKM